MKVYPPSHLTLKESQDRFHHEKNIKPIIVSDETLVHYVTNFLEQYRKTLEQYFSEIAPFLTTYRNYPYKVSIVRMDNGVFIFYQSAVENLVEIQDFDELSPKVEANLFEIKKLFDPCWGEFDFSNREYSKIEAEIRGKAMALDDVLQVFWLLIEKGEDFEKVCLNLIEAETEYCLERKIIEDSGSEIDLKLEIILNEIADFRKTENWGFIFKHYKEDRITADLLHQIEIQLENDHSLDIVCLVTSGDITSIGRAIAVKNPKIRVWDRGILNRLINKHLTVIGKYFRGYDLAVETLSSEIEKIRYSRFKEFESKLANCPTGKEFFTQYELICKEILDYIFEDKLKPFNNQSLTRDGTQRRDSIFRNLRNSKFFERIFNRFDADFIVFDPKNYSNKITKREFESISKYPNKAIGKFAVLTSRKGASDTALKTQDRIYRNDGNVILSISDLNMLEMIIRKERGENPEDVLEDLLDKLLLGF